jgi:hypothetical protein
MAKGEGRGFRKYLPSIPTIGKVFVALVVIKIINSVVAGQVATSAPQVARYWPVV